MDEMRGRLLVSEIAQRRLDRLASHLCESSPVQEEQLSREICAKLIKRPVNPSVLANLMAGMSRRFFSSIIPNALYSIISMLTSHLCQSLYAFEL